VRHFLKAQNGTYRFGPFLEVRTMPRLIHATPKYRKHKASGQAVVTINGREHYLGPYGTKASKLEYDRLIGEWLSSGRSPSFGAPQHVVSITELIVDYVEYVRGYYGTGPNSELHRVARVLRPVRELYGRTQAIEFGVLQFKAVRQKFIDEGLARSFINASMRRLTRMFKWAASEGRVPPSIPQALAMVSGLRRGKSAARETEPVKPVDDTLVDATLPHLPEVLADMVRVQRLTGCRPAEVCMMRPCDIDRSVDPWQYRPHSHKTAYHGRERIIFIGPQAQAVLLRYLARDPQAHCFRPCDSEAKRRSAAHAARKTPLSCGNVPGSHRVRHKRRRPPGECYNPRAYHQAIRYGCMKAFPVPDDLADDPDAVAKWKTEHHWFPNQLRHTAGTDIRKRFGLEAAQTVLGHSKADVTQVYAERDYALAARVAKEVG
jgi:integrase